MKDVFISSYTNKKNVEKFSIGVTKEFLESLYYLEKNAYEQLFDQISEHIDIEIDDSFDDKFSEFTNFLKIYFSF